MFLEKQQQLVQDLNHYLRRTNGSYTEIRMKSVTMKIGKLFPDTELE